MLLAAMPSGTMTSLVGHGPKTLRSPRTPTLGLHPIAFFQFQFRGGQEGALRGRGQAKTRVELGSPFEPFESTMNADDGEVWLCVVPRLDPFESIGKIAFIAAKMVAALALRMIRPATTRLRRGGCNRVMDRPCRVRSMGILRQILCVWTRFINSNHHREHRSRLESGSSVISEARGGAMQCRSHAAAGDCGLERNAQSQSFGCATRGAVVFKTAARSVYR